MRGSNLQDFLKFHGLENQTKFEIVELEGVYYISNGVVYDNSTNKEVKGLIDHLLDETWHIKWSIK